VSIDVADLLTTFVILYISALFKFNYPLANEVLERLYKCNNATARPSATFRA
jgi:hypothetical protein